MHIAGPLASTILCISFALLQLFTDTLHILFPIIHSRRYHASNVRNLFGPLVGIQGFDKIHAHFTLWLMLIIIYGVHVKSTLWATITVTALATAQPYFLLVAYYRRACDIKGSWLALLISAVFGIVGLLWRLHDDNQSWFKPRLMPVIALWHFYVSMIAFFFLRRMRHNSANVAANIELEKYKYNALVNNDCTWGKGQDSPEFHEGFEPYPVLVQTAEVEIEEKIHFTPKKFILFYILISISGYMTGISQVYNHVNLISDQIVVYSLFAIISLILAQILSMASYMLCCYKTPERELFDDIEGARSFDASEYASPQIA